MFVAGCYKEWMGLRNYRFYRYVHFGWPPQNSPKMFRNATRHPPPTIKDGRRYERIGVLAVLWKKKRYTILIFTRHRHTRNLIGRKRLFWSGEQHLIFKHWTLEKLCWWIGWRLMTSRAFLSSDWLRLAHIEEYCINNDQILQESSVTWQLILNICVNYFISIYNICIICF